MRILRQYITNGRKVTEYTQDGLTVSHITEQSAEKVETPEPEPSQIGLLKEENKALKERLALVEAAVDDIIFGGNF
jgi:hypothetical protein